MLFQTIYLSFATQPFDDQALIALLTKARAANAPLGITGLLLYHDGVFAQLLEGPKESVELVMGRILADRRHARVTLLLRELSPFGAIFPDWTMGFLHMRALDRVGIPGLETSDLGQVKGRIRYLYESNAARILHNLIQANGL